MKTKDFFKLGTRVSLDAKTQVTGANPEDTRIIAKRIRQLDDYSKRPHSFKKHPFTKLKCEMGEKAMPLHFHDKTHMPPMPNSRVQ